MAWNGSGVFTRLYSWVADKNAGIPITASRMDADTDDIVTGLENTVTLDGQTTPVHSLPMGGFTHTNVGNATARTNYAAAGQVQDCALLYGGVSGGSANVQTISLTPAITSYVAGQKFHFIAGFSNTGALTLNVNSVGAKAVQWNGAALSGGEIVLNGAAVVEYDGTQFQLVASSRAFVGDSGSGGSKGLVPAPATGDAAAKKVLGAGGAWTTNVFTGDSGSGGTVGQVPAPASGDATANKFLKSSGSWAALPNTTVQVLTSGTAATYTTPTGCRQLQVYAKGGGGGGGGSGTASSTAGGAGGTTIFNSINAAGGGGGAASGSNGVPGSGGTGGSGTATWRTPGAGGGGSMSFTTNVAGGTGGGKGSGTGTSTGGLSGVANSGGGGGGATAASGGTVSGGGGGGEGEEFFLIINSPSATYTYTIGAAGTAGAAGTSGSSGGAGGSGVIRVVEIY